MTFPMEKNYDKLFRILKHLVLKEKNCTCATHSNHLGPCTGEWHKPKVNCEAASHVFSTIESTMRTKYIMYALCAKNFEDKSWNTTTQFTLN